MGYSIFACDEFPEFRKQWNLIGNLGNFDLLSGPWIAGGAVWKLICGESISNGDIDVWFQSQTQWNNFTQILRKYDRKSHVTEHHFSYSTWSLWSDDRKVKIQCIRSNYYQTAIEILKSFDLTVCQCATDGRYIIALDSSIEDIKNKALRFSRNGIINQQQIIRRVAKYCQYGFNPDLDLLRYVSENLDHCIEKAKHVDPQDY